MTAKLALLFLAVALGASDTQKKQRDAIGRDDEEGQHSVGERAGTVDA